MNMTPDIKLIIEDGKKVYVAPARSEICIRLDFHTKKETASISEPFLVKRGVERGCEWGEFFGHTMVLRLGRYVQASELKRLKTAVTPYLQVVRAGYRRVDDKGFASFDDVALMALDNLHRVVSGFTFEFEQPYDPDAGFAGFLLDMTDSELAQLSRYPSSTLKNIAVDFAKRCYPHMHPWDAYIFLKSTQKNLKENYFAQS